MIARWPLLLFKNSPLYRSLGQTQTGPCWWYDLTPGQGHEQRTPVRSLRDVKARGCVAKQSRPRTASTLAGIQSPRNNNTTLTHYHTHEHEVAPRWAYLPDAERERRSQVKSRILGRPLVAQVSHQVSLPRFTDSLWGTCLWVNHNTRTHTPPSPAVKCGTRVLWQNQRSRL